MKTCKIIRSDFLPALYGELTGERERRFRAHLEACSECRESYDRMAGTLDLMNRRERTDPGDAYWRGYWDRLENRLDPLPETRASRGLRFRWMLRWKSLPVWSLRAAAAAALVVIGIFIGRMIPGENTGQGLGKTGTENRSVHMTALETRTERYLDRSRTLILGLVNFDPATEDPVTLNLVRRQKISQELLQESDSLRMSLNRPADSQLRSLIADLEVILLQIANLEQEQKLQAVEMVRDGVNRRGILLKINLETMRRGSQPPVPEETDAVPAA